ncbi:hypothetical protein [Salinisphaera sp.]|uniref:hypothetical protein n=1 Tax=Salinisphaera sp. TaxID=1914330 RepID=UPI002D76F021|nr:hypothetical protein [Salinisphaera sp.]HET7315036.1 hypothetical protein [Salinisphaera sp.]
MDPVLDEKDISYGRAMHPWYEEIKSVFVQVGGFLILRSASTKIQLEMSDRMSDVRRTLDMARSQLKQLVPPKKYRNSHAQLAASADGLDQVLKEVLAMNRSTARSTHRAERVLSQAYEAFKQGSVCEIGLHTVDLNCSCCALSVP